MHWPHLSLPVLLPVQYYSMKYPAHAASRHESLHHPAIVLEYRWSQHTRQGKDELQANAAYTTASS